MNPGLLPRLERTRRFPLASLAGETYVTPATVDLRAQLLFASNQGNRPQCAAYAMAGWLEFQRWKKFGIAQQIDPEPIYRRAKEIDGAPHAEGTWLESVLQAAQDLNLMDAVAAAAIVEISNPWQARQALHRYGVVLSAFEITDRWSAAQPDGWIPTGGNRVGGHAVLLCGYSDADNPPWFAVQNSWGESSGWRGFNRLTPQQFEEQFQYGLVWQ